MKLSTKSVVQVAVSAALISIATFAIAIPIPVGGYVHLGDTVIFIVSSMMHPLLAFFAASLGSALADGIAGYGQYALFTFFIKGGMAFVSAVLLRKINRRYKLPLAGGAGILCMVSGYFIADVLLSGSAQAALTASVWNVVQGLVGWMLSVLILKSLRMWLSSK